MRLSGLGPFPFLLLFLLTRHGCLGHDIPFADHLQLRDSHKNSSHNVLANSSNPSNSSRPLATGSRTVYLVMHVRLSGSQTFPPTYEKLFPAYASLHFNATSTDGPLEIQLVNQDDQDILRVTDWGLANADKPLGVPQPGYLSDFFELFGKSNATNKQILDASTGKGLIYDVWSRNNSLALKAYNSVDFMLACIAKLGLGVAPSDNPSAVIPSRIALAQTYWRNLWVAEKVISNYPIWFETLDGWESQVKKSRAEFRWRAGSDPSSGMVHSRPVPVEQQTNNSLVDNGISDLAAPEMTETYLASSDTIRTAPEFQFIYANPANVQKLQRRVTPVRDQYLVFNPGEEFPVIGQRLELKDGKIVYAMKDVPGSSTDVEPVGGSGSSGTSNVNAPLADDLVSPENRMTNAVASRIGQMRFTTLLRGLVGAGAIVGSFAVILTDISDHQKSNAQLCGILAGGTLVASFFAYLFPPGLAEFLLVVSIFVGEIPDFTKSVDSSNYTPVQNHFGGATGGVARGNFGGGGRGKRAPSVPTPPLRTDVQGILQYTIVGDRNQTGNEKCISKGHQNCTVVYGPYLLATALQIEPFDAFALLIHYNEGFPMAMADLVKAFSLSTDPDSPNQVATIDCSHSTKPNDRFSWSNPNTATILKECDKPSFSINRKLVKVPILEQTADLIYDRLMPQGNCALVGDVTGGEKYAAYNLTIMGGAVAIACGIVGAINMNQTASPLPGAPANQSVPLSLVNAGNQSSDGSSGRAYIAPPPMAPFQSTLNLTNSVCMGASDGSKLCFPNGTYGAQDGGLGFDSTKANTLELDANSSVVITESTRARSKGNYAHAPAPPQKYIDHKAKYSTNQSATDTGFGGDMQNMNKYKRDNTFTVYVPVEPDAACFYQQPLGMGDFACFGPGGGDLPAGLKGKTMSVKAYGRASVEIFANSYGNSFSHIIDTYEDDLSQLPYDKQSNFANVAASIWVYLEPGPRIPTMGGSPSSSPSSANPPGATAKSQV